MDIVDGKPHSYLGDGVYAVYDGFGIWLRTNDHREHLCTNKVYLEPAVIRALNTFYERVLEMKKGYLDDSKKK